MIEEGQNEIQPRGNLFQRLFRRVPQRHIVSEEKDEFETPTAPRKEEDPSMVQYQEVERIWEQHFSGKVPKSWEMWYGAVRNFEEGGSKDSLLVEAAVLHPHYLVGREAGMSQRLTSEQLAVIIYRDDFPYWAKEEIYEAQQQMGVSTGEFREAQECARRFAKGVNTKEDGSQAVAFLPPTSGDVSLAHAQERTAFRPQQAKETVRLNEVAEINPGELMNEALDLLGLERRLRPEIFYAQTPEEFKAKIDEHFEKAGVPPEAVNLQACYYSGVLKECVIHPEVMRMLETVGNDLDAFNHLRHFEYVIHEVLHGAYDLLMGDGFDVPIKIGSEGELYEFYTGTLKPLEEYMVSIVAHDVVIQLRDKITGGRIHPGLLEAFIKQNRASSLDPAKEEHFVQVFGRLVSKDDSEKARFFTDKWKASGGVSEVLGQYLQARA